MGLPIWTERRKTIRAKRFGLILLEFRCIISALYHFQLSPPPSLSLSLVQRGKGRTDRSSPRIAELDADYYSTASWLTELIALVSIFLISSRRALREQIRSRCIFLSPLPSAAFASRGLSFVFDLNVALCTTCSHLSNSHRFTRISKSPPLADLFRVSEDRRSIDRYPTREATRSEL